MDFNITSLNNFSVKKAKPYKKEPFLPRNPSLIIVTTLNINIDCKTSNSQAFTVKQNKTKTTTTTKTLRV
jgi:hypothetical protein